jgi:hypothetical protein
MVSSKLATAELQLTRAQENEAQAQRQATAIACVKKTKRAPIF